MNFFSAIFLIFVAVNAVTSKCPNKKTNSKLICYYSKLTEVDSCKCSHVILPANSDVKSIDRFREHAKGVKILITVNEFNQGLVNILKSSKVDGIEISLKKLDSKNDISDFISTVRSKLGSDLYIVLSVPSKAETLAKYYDFKSLSKNADLFILQTAFLGASKNVTFHPSRLSGLWDMQNTDSVVDLVSGLGAPLSKLVITAPVQAFKFKLQDEKHTAPGSPALEVQSITRDELCNVMGNGGNWTLERDQDQTGPYIFSKNQWIAFDDPISIDIKAKYARVRGLAGMALKDLSQDGGTKCESSILEAAFTGLSRQARAPRGAVLHSLEREILETPVRPLDTIQVSPYRISRVIDVEGNVHVIRKDTRTEFECSRQGYFVHPHSCGRFYRCVKFDQLSDEFSVFEFDCPAGLAFDSRVEVCVWPGSLPHASPCSGSSEIAPVPRERFVCPSEPGYYADPENCRWFFACLDHGKSPLSAYEFRCPFGLVYDESRLLCEWPWLVPKCASGAAVVSEFVYGGSGTVALERYDGLGVLGATALGGLHGPLQQPAIYSNVGNAGQSYAIGTGQLSLKAAHSLQNAGLLKTGFVDNGNSGNVAFGLEKVDGAQLVYTQGQDSTLGSSYHGVGFSQNAGASLINTGLYQGNVASGIRTNYDELGANLNYQTGLSGAELKSVEGYQTNLHLVDTNSGNANAYLVNGLAESGKVLANGLHAQGATVTSGYGNAKSSVEYHGNTGSSYESGTSGNINIVGGGYSAVGVANNGIQVTDYGASSSVAHVTQSPISIATGSSIPTVTSVPVPAIKVASGFESYRGGVVANVPELQYKVHSNVGFDVANASNGFVNFVSSTPSTLTAEGGYRYPKPTVAFVEEPVKTVVSTGTSYVQQNVASVQPVVTAFQKPVVISTSQTPLVVQPVVTTYQKPVAVVSGVNIKSQVSDFDGHDYPKPNVKFEEVPVQTTGTSFSYHKTEGYAYPKPAIAFEEGPLKTVSTISYSTPSTVKPVTLVQPVVQPQLQVTSYDIPSSTTRPVVVEQPQVYVSSTPAPIQPVIKQQAQSVISFQRHESVQPQLEVTYNLPSSTVKPIVVQQPNYPRPVSTYTYKNLVQSVVNQGYSYPRPAVAFEETPASVTKLHYAQPAVVSSYSYTAPSTQRPAVFVHQPVTYVSSTPKPEILVQKQAPVVTSYTYNAPSTLVVSSTPKPQVVAVQSQIPSVVSSYSFTNEAQSFGYKYPKPAVAFVEEPAQKVSFAAKTTGYTYNAPSTVKPAVFVQQPAVSTYVSSTPQPIVFKKQPSAVSSYSFTNEAQSYGYDYPKPAVAFVEEPAPVVTSYENRQPVQEAPFVAKKAYVTGEQRETSYTYNAPSTVKPAVFVQEPVVSTYVSSTPKPDVLIQKQTPVVISYTSSTVKPAVVSTYVSSTPQPVVIKKQPSVVSSYSFTNEAQSFGYDYPKPAVPFVEEPTPVVTTYENRQPVQKVSFATKTTDYTYQKPIVSTYVSTTPQPVVFKKQPSVVSSYSFTNEAQSYGYDYPKPAVPFVEEPYENHQPVQKVSFGTKTTGYTYQKPVVSTYVSSTPQPIVFKKQPSVVSSYSFTNEAQSYGYDYPKPAVPFVKEPYENRQPVQEVPFVAKKTYVTGGQATSYQQLDNVVNIKEQPVQPVIVSTTPKYEYKQQYSIDSGYVYNKPEVSFKEKPVVIENYQAPVVSTSPKAIVDYTYVQSTPKPTFASVITESVVTKQPFTFYDSRLTSTARPVTYSTSVPVVETTSRPIGSLDDQYQYTKSLEYLPPEEIKTPVVVTTSRPIAKYSFSSLDTKYQQPKIVENYVAPKVETFVVPEVTTPIPVRTRVKVTTSVPEVVTPTREYLPVKAVPSSTYLPVDDDIVSTRRPVKVIKVARPKTIVKVNDFHPLLSAKLGAQCTCVSNSVRLNGKKKKLRIVVEDDDDDDGYVVDNNNGNGVVVENYQYEPQKLVEITPTPEVYIKSTTSQIIEPSSSSRKRVRVRPATTTVLYESPVTEAAEVFLKKSVTPAVLVNAVAEKEPKVSVDSRGFDRYGPGGWRSRNEKLQGTIDCQRAGLFRHPTQCNKFYACRWDCTKNRYTLHVFNCPVHLTFDNNLGACNWPSQGPACLENTLLPSD